MGNVSSRPEEGSLLYLRDQDRLSVVNVKILTANQRVLYNVFPNNYPATRYTAQKECDDEGMVEFVQDQETVGVNGSPNFLLKLGNDEDITFYFTLALRQTTSASSADTSHAAPPVDTVINNLTFVRASTPKEMNALITREFNADPNIHRNPNVDLVGDYSTSGNASETFEWSWTWTPPKPTEDRGCGWRNTCSFVEYDQRAHRLNTLVTFSFWVHNNQRMLNSPRFQSPRIELTVPPRPRVPSSQSIDSRMSDSDTDMSGKDAREPPSPTLGPTISAIPEDEPILEPTFTAESIPPSVKLDLMAQRNNDDISAVDDGPLFRSTMKQLENKTGTMKARMKNVIERAKILKASTEANNMAYENFLHALRETSASNANAVKPALEHYFDKIAREILAFEERNASNLNNNIIEPLSRIYRNDIKMVEVKKESFDKESKEYYNYVGRYLGQRSDSLKEKKKVEEDSKYQSKRKTFELKRFDYSSFMQDLHGGRKDQEVLSLLTKYADTQASSYLDTSKKIESMIPQLDALNREVKEADKEYALMRTGREEKRRALEKGEKMFSEPDNAGSAMPRSEADLGISGLTGIAIDRTRSPPLNGSLAPESLGPSVAIRSGSSTAQPSREPSGAYPPLPEEGPVQQNRKEGLLWSMSRPGGHTDPRGALPKQAWHKFWIVLDQGRLCEYVNWKQNMEPHMDPIDLRVASVREARAAERRFCFEVITPNFTRVYQATGEDDMRSWIQAINNALQSAFEGQGRSAPPSSSQTSTSSKGSGSIARDLFGKSSSYHGHRSTSSTNYLSAKNISRHATVPDRPPQGQSRTSEEQPARLLQQIRAADAGNTWCADCGSDTRVEWVSINLGIIVCIECSGIHRSLGTHISKVRSLTLDTASFTQDVVELLLTIGNRVSNMVWEASLDRMVKPRANSPREQRLHFITAKYVQKLFVQPLGSVAGAITSDDTLLTSIKRNDIQHVVHALALSANPNVADRSRGTHAVFLALVAADPATPGSGTASPAARPASPMTHGPTTRKSFPVAELLIQNGATVPEKTSSPVPLSKDATLYLDFKMAQKLGRLGATEGSASAMASPAASPGMARGDTSDQDRSARERLAKRASMGSDGRGRLVKNPPLR